MSYTSQTATT